MKLDFLPSPLELPDSIRDCGAKLQMFLCTHPVSIGTRNSMSVLVGEGGTIGSELASVHIADEFDKFIEAL